MFLACRIQHKLSFPIDRAFTLIPPRGTRVLLRTLNIVRDRSQSPTITLDIVIMSRLPKTAHTGRRSIARSVDRMFYSGDVFY